MMRSTKITFCFLLFVSPSYQSVITEITSNNFASSETLKFNESLLQQATHLKFTKEEESIFRKAIAYELENKTILNAASNFLSAYFRKNDDPSSGPLKTLKQKYKLRKSTTTTTEYWDQSLEEEFTIPQSTTTLPATSTIPISETTKDSIAYEPKAIVETTSKKPEVLTIYVVPPLSDTKPPPPPPPPPSSKPPYQPYRPTYRPTYYGPSTTPAPWYRHAPNLFDSEQVVPIFTDILVTNINNGNLSSFLLERLVDFSKTDGPAKVAANILDLIF